MDSERITLAPMQRIHSYEREEEPECSVQRRLEDWGRGDNEWYVPNNSNRGAETRLEFLSCFEIGDMICCLVEWIE